MRHKRDQMRSFVKALGKASATVAWCTDVVVVVVVGVPEPPEMNAK